MQDAVTIKLKRMMARCCACTWHAFVYFPLLTHPAIAVSLSMLLLCAAWIWLCVPGTVAVLRIKQIRSGLDADESDAAFSLECYFSWICTEVLDGSIGIALQRSDFLWDCIVMERITFVMDLRYKFFPRSQVMIHCGKEITQEGVIPVIDIFRSVHPHPCGICVGKGPSRQVEANKELGRTPFVETTCFAQSLLATIS